MITPRQFLESFVQEKNAAWAKARPHLIAVYEKYFGEPLLQHVDYYMPWDQLRAVIEEVRQSDDVASAVICEHFKSAEVRKRYHLAAAGESWRIIGIEIECFVCRGNGQLNGVKCEHCNGEGWRESARDAA